jgi:hypothetical protein
MAGVMRLASDPELESPFAHLTYEELNSWQGLPACSPSFGLFLRSDRHSSLARGTDKHGSCGGSPNLDRPGRSTSRAPLARPSTSTQSTNENCFSEPPYREYQNPRRATLIELLACRQCGITDRNGNAVLKRNREPYTKTVMQLKPLEKLTEQQRCLIETITYTESGKPNLKLVSKEYCHRELRKMIGGDAQLEQRANDFSQYTDTELLLESRPTCERASGSRRR